jgi:MFS transporter, DHA1 family, multidrug resistance protein
MGLAMLPCATDFYLPSLPTLRQEFSANVASVQLTLSLFVLIFGVSQTIYGPLSDRFGRKRVLCAGAAIYALGALFCALATSLPMLIAARCLQAFGACSGTVVGRAIVRDRYDAVGSARVLSYLSGLMASFPLLLPTLGGWIVAHHSWRWVFYAVSAYGVLVLLTHLRYVPETNPQHSPGAFSWAALLRDYRTVLRVRVYWGYVLSVTFAYCGIFIFISGSAHVLITHFGVSPTAYGSLFGVAVLPYIVGTFAAARFVKRFGINRILRFAQGFTLIGGLGMLAFALTGALTVTTLMLTQMCFMFGAGLVFAMAAAGAIAPFPQCAGTAAAGIGCIQMIIASIVGYALATFGQGAPMAMAIALAVVALALCVAFYSLVEYAHRKED